MHFDFDDDPVVAVAVGGGGVAVGVAAVAGCDDGMLKNGAGGADNGGNDGFHHPHR